MKLFKDNIEALADAVTYICNLSLRTGVVPKNLMIALVTCLFKSGNKNYFENYFTISILVASSKILEKVVTVQLVNYFVSNDYFAKCQFGYWQGHSTVDAMFCSYSK